MHRLRALFGVVGLVLCLSLVARVGAQSGAAGKKGPAKGSPGAGKEKENDKDSGPPSQIPPAAAKGKKLADFIKGQQSKGADGESLARAINKERARLGLTDDDKDDKKAATSKGKKD